MAEKHAQELAKGQLEINKMESQHRSIFVSRVETLCRLDLWCSSSCQLHFVIAPFVMFSAYFGVVLPELPTFDMGSLMTVLMGMLGLGGLRSFEKYKGLAK